MWNELGKRKELIKNQFGFWEFCVKKYLDNTEAALGAGPQETLFNEKWLDFSSPGWCSMEIIFVVSWEIYQ